MAERTGVCSECGRSAYVPEDTKTSVGLMWFHDNRAGLLSTAQCRRTNWPTTEGLARSKEDQLKLAEQQRQRIALEAQQARDKTRPKREGSEYSDRGFYVGSSQPTKPTS